MSQNTDYTEYASASDFNDDTFWDHARKFAAKVPFTRDMMAMYYCLQDRRTPLWVKGTVAAALAYFALPFDLIPDFIPVLGMTDDAAAIAAAFKAVSSHIKDEHYAQAEQAFT